MIEEDHSEGGHDSAPYPTEVFMMSQAACTAVDIVELLKKMRQHLDYLEIEPDGQGAQDQVPNYSPIFICFTKCMETLKPSKAEKAISLSFTKYCTVSKMIDHIAKITYTFEINSGFSKSENIS